MHYPFGGTVTFHEYTPDSPSPFSLRNSDTAACVDASILCSYIKCSSTSIQSRTSSIWRGHGLSLLKATKLDWERGWLQPDTRKEYGEKRISALVPQGEDLFFRAFVVRGDAKESSRYAVPTAGNADAMTSIKKRIRIRMPTEEEDREITAAALADPDAQPMTDEELDSLVPYRSTCAGARSCPTKNNWCPSATAPKCCSGSAPPARAGRRAWTKPWRPTLPATRKPD
jgi:uncharacterized DUF497 family protein